MANIKSAEKRARRSLAQRETNRRNRSILKSALKQARAAKGGSGEEIRKALAVVYSVLDKSVYKGILHKNAAARHKERLSKLLLQKLPAKA